MGVDRGNDCFSEAVSLLRSMGNFGLEPNLVTYNAIIDAGAKGELPFEIVVKFLEEMIAAGCLPDRLTYNSLLKTCVAKGRWQLCRGSFVISHALSGYLMCVVGNKFN